MREFHNYMLPIEQGGRWFLRTGLRDAQADAFPTCASLRTKTAAADAWFAIRDRLLDPAAARHPGRPLRRAQLPAGRGQDAMREALVQSARQTLGLFAEKGYETLGGFVEKSVPEAERGQAVDVLVRILQGLAWEAWTLHRERTGEPALELNPARHLPQRHHRGHLRQPLLQPRLAAARRLRGTPRDRAVGDTLAGHAACSTALLLVLCETIPGKEEFYGNTALFQT